MARPRLAARGCCCAACEPGAYPRGGRVHLRLWAAERLADAVRRRQPGRCAVDDLLRAGARRQGRPRRRPALAAAGHRHAQAGQGRADRARGRPVRVLAGRRPAARRHGSGSVPAPRSAPAARCCPGARIGKRAEIAAGSGVVRRGARPVSAGPARRPCGSAGPAHRWPAAAAPRSPSLGAAPTALTSLLLGLLPVARPRCPVWLILGAVRAGTRHAGRRAAGALPACRWPPWPAGQLRAADPGSASGCSASACTAGHYPVHSRVGWQAWTTERLMDMARIAAVPAVRQPVHAGVAARCSVRRSVGGWRRRRCWRCPR